MREILFRGKRLINDEWVEGLLVKDRAFYGKPENHAYIVNHECPSGCFGRDIYYEVDPETVGQYTGLQDKDGNKLFEGDIVEAKFIGGVTSVRFVITFLAGAFSFMVKNTHHTMPSLYDLRLIGNIHDNPELMEGE